MAYSTWNSRPAGLHVVTSVSYWFLNMLDFDWVWLGRRNGIQGVCCGGRRRRSELCREFGAHLYYNCPSGNYFEYQAFAIGSRSQAAKTYLERRFNNFTASSREDLIKDALIATRESLQGEKLRSSVCTIAVVGVGEPFHILDQETVQQLIDTFEIVREEESAPAEPEVATEQDAAPDQAPGADQGGAENQGGAEPQGGSPMDI